MSIHNTNLPRNTRPLFSNVSCLKCGEPIMWDGPDGFCACLPYEDDAEAARDTLKDAHEQEEDWRD